MNTNNINLKKKAKKRSKLAKFVKMPQINLIGAAVLCIGLFLLIGFLQQPQDQRSRAAGEQTNQTNLSYSAEGYTSQYHLYAGGLDWTKSVGLLLYTDGSGEYGLKNPNDSYLLGGSSGMIAVAKKHNMILLTPFSPNKSCSDGDGSCWYLGDSPGYTKWAESLVTSIESQYPIDKKRVAVGGYSSGAQFSTEFWVPSGAAQRTMEKGVIVAISYGGSPKVNAVGFDAGFKTNVHMNWNTGDQDEAYTSAGKYGVKAGHDFYTDAGFQTSLDVLSGKDHDRSGEFGAIMDAQISKHVPAAAANGTANPTLGAPSAIPTPTLANPTYYCAGSEKCVPTGTQVTKSPTKAPQKEIQEKKKESGDTNDDQGFAALINRFFELLLRLFAALLG